MNSWEIQIEEDLKWREAEIASLKMLAASAQSGSDRQRGLLRAAGAMLYAHYEGFCKFCWDILLDSIEREQCARSALTEPTAILSMAATFKAMKSNFSDKEMWKLLIEDFHKLMAEPAKFRLKLETKSNLWPDLAQENNSKAGLHCPLFSKNYDKLKQLVGHRNEIAHGKKLVIKNLNEIQEFEQAALLAMHDLAVAVVNCLDNKNYLLKNLQPE